jgi:hypothetical protein
MNKQLLFKLSLMCALLVAASTAYASVSITGSTVMGGGTFAPSKNVTINVASDPTGGYTAMSFHSQGDKFFATNNSDTKMYWKQKGSDTTTAPANYSTTISTGWTSL